MPIKDCIGKLQGIRPEMKDKILSYKEKYLKEGLDERKAEIKAVESYGKDLHDRLNKLKKAVDVKEDVYKPYDSTEKKKAIEEKYSELEKQQAEQSIKEKDLVTPSVESVKVFDAVEKADRSKISQREKTKAIEEAMSEFGEMGKKAMEINKDFENIVAELKRQNKLEVKC